MERNGIGQRPIIISFIALLIVCSSHLVQSVTIDNAAYKDIVLEIKDYVPVEKCSEILLDLEVRFLICS